MSNTLLEFAASTKKRGAFSYLPPFADIGAQEVGPAVDALCAQVDADLSALEAELEGGLVPTFANTCARLSAIWSPLSRVWGAVSHLTRVADEPELRAAHEEAQPKVVALGIRASQSTAIHAAYRKIADGSLNGGERRHVDARILSARLSGIELAGQAQESFNAWTQELSELGTKFGNNVLDVTKAFELRFTDKADVDGLPKSDRKRAALASGVEGASADAGPWKIGLDSSSFVGFMRHAKSRQYRETLYRAYVTRASAGEHDNTPLIERVLELRQLQCDALGFADYFEKSLASKMAASVGDVRALLDELATAAKPVAKAELAELEKLCGRPGLGDALMPWDIAFATERLREERYDLRDEEVRPYFPYDRVMDGLYRLASRLFAVTIAEKPGFASVWNDDVRFFEISDKAGPVAGFYIDAFARPENKHGGAWMDECVGREREDGAIILPVAYINCNQTPPAGDTPSLMTFREVETLFHEFGHALQHMLTTQELGEVSGINNVEWDAVELASQFMENWCYDVPTLRSMARHYESGEELPDALVDKLLAARTFMTGYQTLRQVEFARVDIALHHGYNGGDIHELRKEIGAETGVFPSLAEDRFLNAFSHIFAGGYGAGYYSYKWAEVLSADAFAAFEEVGLDDEKAVQEIGARYRDTVLGLGGSKHPMEVFELFRGRPPKTDALKKHSGLA